MGVTPFQDIAVAGETHRSGQSVTRLAGSYHLLPIGSPFRLGKPDRGSPPYNRFVWKSLSTKHPWRSRPSHLGGRRCTGAGPRLESGGIMQAVATAVLFERKAVERLDLLPREEDRIARSPSLPVPLACSSKIHVATAARAFSPARVARHRRRRPEPIEGLKKKA